MSRSNEIGPRRSRERSKHGERGIEFKERYNYEREKRIGPKKVNCYDITSPRYRSRMFEIDWDEEFA